MIAFLRGMFATIGNIAVAFYGESEANLHARRHARR